MELTKEERCEIAKRAQETTLAKYGKYAFEGRNHTQDAKTRIGAANALHMAGTGNHMYGKIRITNDAINRTTNKGEEIPQGWRRGLCRKTVKL
jgi:hypothetical protein